MKLDKNKIINKCKILLEEYKNGGLGQTIMPEDVHPVFQTKEEKLIYFSLPMALNYQRNSYTLWESALKTWGDNETRKVFDLEWVSKAGVDDLREKLLKYKLALQPNKHINSWKKISEAVYKKWGSFENMFLDLDNDFLKIKNVLQKEEKKNFPYLSGPKIFNYWSFIILTYGGVNLKNKKYIDIAPDTHILKCSIKLGVISEEESIKLSKDDISQRWREILEGSRIDPIDMHSPLWFWSRNGFIFDFKK